jgi:hypothetical protein
MIMTYELGTGWKKTILAYLRYHPRISGGLSAENVEKYVTPSLQV